MKWYFIMVAVMFVAMFTFFAIDGYSDSQKQTQIGIACVQAGKTWDNGKCQ